MQWCLAFFIGGVSVVGHLLVSRAVVIFAKILVFKGMHVGGVAEQGK